MGYEPVLSEDGDVFFDPSSHTHDSCLNEVENAQIFILIIGGRYGGRYEKTEDSITNKEYRTAVKKRIPVFTLVERSVYNEHFVYQKNKDNAEVIDKIKFPSVDSLKIFEFINEVRSAEVNNAFSSFSDFSDIEDYLKKQWAGMLYNFLQKESEHNRIEKMFDQLSQINRNTEKLSKLILDTVGTDENKIEAGLYELMLSSTAVSPFIFWKNPITPKDVIKYDQYRDCIRSKVKGFRINNGDGVSINSDYSMSQKKFEKEANAYKVLRNKMVDFLRSKDKSVEEYLEKASNED